MTPDDKSGSNREWAEGLADISGKECRDILSDIAGLPVHRCEVEGCLGYSSYLGTFHGCTWFTLCHAHKVIWAAFITRAIEVNGKILCDTCDGEFLTLAGAMQWRAI